MCVVDFIVRIFLSFIPLNNIAGAELNDTSSMDAMPQLSFDVFLIGRFPPSVKV